jgi:hypothetical protein
MIILITLSRNTPVTRPHFRTPRATRLADHLSRPRHRRGRGGTRAYLVNVRDINGAPQNRRLVTLDLMAPARPPDLDAIDGCTGLGDLAIFAHDLLSGAKGAYRP